MNTETDFPPNGDVRVRATAWALGQLNPDDAAAFEGEMTSDPDLEIYAREMQHFCRFVSLELPPHEADLVLPEPRRAPVVAALSSELVSEKRHIPFNRPLLALGLSAAAACLVLTFEPHWLEGNRPVELRPSGSPALSSYTVDGMPPEAPLQPAAEPVTIKPLMPKPLFVGTPLPQDGAPPNLDRSTTPVLEVKVPAGTTLVSLGKPVTSNDSAPIGDLSLITDGDKQGDDGYFTDLMPGQVWVQIDLGSQHEIWLLWVWHFHKQNVIFNDVIVRISDDPLFQTATTVFNNDYDNSSGLGIGNDPSYIETNNGRPMPVNGVKGRYVRFYSKGRDLDDTNQYIEAEVYGRPAGHPATLLAAAPAPPAILKEKLLPDLHSSDDRLKPAVPGAPAIQTVNGPVALQVTSASIRPAMPKPLFTGTPLPFRSRQLHSFSPNEAAFGRGIADYGNAAARGNLPASESYQALPPNRFQETTQNPLSTFSIDVDTASYANVRRFLNQGQRPPAEAVRLEELVNYFPYEETPPQDGKPFAVKVDLTATPWNPAHRLARIALKGKEMAAAQRPHGNLVFLVDVSGSMADANKLPLVQQSLRLLTERLTENDRVSLVTYAGSSSVVLNSTNGQEKDRIMAAIDALSSGGSTNGSGGLESAYQQAVQHFIKDGVNRVILATDGDFNVGMSSHEALLSLIQDKAQTGVFLSVLGYGMGNLKDDTMELLANKGNGNYAYIDSLSEARKTLVEQMSGTLVTIAKDVKIQIEFNPAAVKSWRLLGYENRLLAKEDFNDDTKDAGEIGAGHNVTALYEIVPAGAPDAALQPVVDGLKYQQVPAVAQPRPEPTAAALSGELMNVKLRWKQPAGESSELLEIPVRDAVVPLDQAGQETRWATAVAAFAQRLRGETTATLTWDQIRELARGAKGADPFGYRGEFLQLIDKARSVCP